MGKRKAVTPKPIQLDVKDTVESVSKYKLIIRDFSQKKITTTDILSVKEIEENGEKIIEITGRVKWIG